MRRSKAAPQHEFFPGFTDIAEIGVGSLATVFRAREIGTNRLVALKLLNVRDASPRALESFERESVALGAVSSHPNIVTLYRTFRAADQRPVLVLELCHGSIADRMPTDAGLPVAEVVALGIKIAGALETAHRAEILHRDVKPQNILITEFGEPALADFGVAMLQSSTQTTAGLFDFTTLHAAPELLEGGATSAATDVYELASTLYQLIAGRAAFRAYEGESPASVILRILRDPVQPLVNSQAPPSLSDLLLHAMSKDQGSRPPTAAEFAAGLAGVEVEYGWPRTQFLIRDIGGGTSGLPTYTRLPDAGQQAAPDFAAPASAAPPVPPAEPAQAVPEDDWSTPTVSGRPVEHPPAPAMDPRPTNERVLPDPAELGPVVAPFDEFVDDAVVDEPVDEAGVDEPVDEAAASTESDGWSEVHLVQAHVEPPSDSGDPSDLVEPVAAAEPATSTGVAAAAAWEPPPPPDVVDAEVPRPANPDTREVKLANREALLAAPAAAQADRLEAERVEAERVEAERVEAERVEAERVEAERVEAERVEAERVEAERLEAERLEAERVEAERVEAERVEQERVEAERVEAERVEAERV
ncbi:protein kinase, partial [uncultured Jatrophihabitans sp.]|uniref:serine/threonine-protein kinase n=1 Tax=uncultured Jatrophihabitans sp. TaxID=1610747 RepID=UPI0035CAD05B